MLTAVWVALGLAFLIGRRVLTMYPSDDLGTEVDGVGKTWVRCWLRSDADDPVWAETEAVELGLPLLDARLAWAERRLRRKARRRRRLAARAVRLARLAERAKP